MSNPTVNHLIQNFTQYAEHHQRFPMIAVTLFVADYQDAVGEDRFRDLVTSTYSKFQVEHKIPIDFQYPPEERALYYALRGYVDAAAERDPQFKRRTAKACLALFRTFGVGSEVYA